MTSSGTGHIGGPPGDGPGMTVLTRRPAAALTAAPAAGRVIALLFAVTVALFVIGVVTF